MKKERLHLTTSEYNVARMLEELKNIVIENNGIVLKNQFVDVYLLSNRTLTQIIKELEFRIAELEEMQKEPINNSSKHELRKKIIASKKEELKRYCSINNEPIETSFKTYMYFILNNDYYYIGFDSNLFIPANYSKIKLESDYSYIGTYYHEELPNKETITHEFYSFDPNIEESALLLFNTLLESKYSKKYYNSKRVRVANTYNNKYHYETIYEKEKVNKVNTSLFMGAGE